MKSTTKRSFKSAIAKLLITCMVALSVVIITPNLADAASSPKLNKTTINLLQGKKYDLNVKNKIAKSTYSWKSSNKKVATVDKKGVVKGVKKGTVTITCKVKAKKKTYNLKCKVTVIKPALAVKIKNKTAALNVGQEYDLNRTLAPSNSNDKTYWSTSNKSIADPDKNGKFVALKAGTVTLTAKTLSGVKDTVKIKVVDKEGTVATQSELDTLLKSAASNITIKTDDEAEFTIAEGDYSKKKLVVDAPKSDVINSGVFASIDINQIKASTWYEKAQGNKLVVSASEARIDVSANASTSIEINKEDANVKINNSGTIKEVHIIKAGKVEFTGSSTNAIPVVSDSDVSITSSVPLTLTCNAKVDLVLKKGAEGTTIQVDSEANMPNIVTEVTITVTIGTGANAITKTIEGSSSVSGGGSGGGSTPSKTTVLFNKVIDGIDSISVTNNNGDVFSTDLLGSDNFALIKSTLKANAAGAAWLGLTDYSKKVGNQTVSIKGTGATKVVSISGGALDGKSYDVTVTNSSATIKNAAGDTVTLTRNSDDTFSLTTAVTIDDALSADTTAKLLDRLKSVTVTYNKKAYTVDVPALATIQNYVANSSAYYTVWMANDTVTRTVGGKTITFTGEGATKVTTIAGKTFIVTASTDSVVVKSGDYTATISKSTDKIAVTLN